MAEEKWGKATAAARATEARAKRGGKEWEKERKRK